MEVKNIMFSYKEFTDFLEEIGEYGDKKRRKIMNSYLSSDDFYGWLFKPAQPDKKVAMDINEMMSKMYDLLCKKKVMKVYDIIIMMMISGLAIIQMRKFSF